MAPGDSAPPSLERLAESIKPCVPQSLIACDPRLKLAERLGTQRIDPVLSGRSNLNKPGLQQETQMSRHAGLVDIEGVDNVIHLLLAAP